MIKRLIPEGLIILTLLGLVAGWLPTSGWWQSFIKEKTEAKDKLAAMGNYTHPAIPKSQSNNIDGLKAKTYIILDSKTNTILAAKNHNEKIYPASTTKLATALTALNIFPLDEVVTVKEEYKEGKVMELAKGEKMTVKSLVTALLVYSANDAAYNLANHHGKGVEGFVAEMNQLMKKYKISRTNFTNFDGIDQANHYSTAYDLAQLGRLSIKNQIIRETVKETTMMISDVDAKRQHQLTATNELLGQLPEIQGLKTGWTPEAGGCFVGLINIDGHELISVVAQSEDRFDDTRKMVDWVKKNVVWGTYQQ